MAKNYTTSFATPDKDTGWGLIFRLNDLWRDADSKSIRGDYDGWELVLDAIFRNLLYRNEMEVVLDNDENVLDVEVSEQDVSEWKLMKEKIRNAKLGKNKAKNLQEIKLNAENYYMSLFFYDIWLRKFMQKQGLYLKEMESNPSKALFGGAFKK